MLRHYLLALLLVLPASALTGDGASLDSQLDRRSAPRAGLVEPMDGARIAWYGTLAGALAEAQRTERPILLLSAAPHCSLVPGVW